MKIVHFDLAVEFEPTPSADDIDTFRDQLAAKLDDLEATTGFFDFIGSVNFTGLEIIKPDRRKARKVRRSYKR